MSAVLSIINVQQFAEVRALIDVSLEEANLPDDVIRASVYGGAAENWAIGEAGDISAWPDDALQRLRVAVCYRLAGMLIPVVPNLTQEQRGEREHYSRIGFNVERRQQELYALASDALAAAIDLAGIEVEGIGAVPIFTLGRGRRRW